MSLLPIMMWLNIPFSPLEKHKRPYDDVLAAPGVGGRGRVFASGMKRPARDGAVGHRVIARQHRDLGRLLLGKPVPLVVGAVGEAGGLADAVVVDPVVVDVRLVGERGPGAEQWRGYTHTVLVREDGFEYDGRRYRSLTVIAEQITGAHWSGPRFFGLTKRARAP